VIEFLLAESERPAYVHGHLLKAHSEVTVGLNTVGRSIRWIKEAVTGRGEIHGQPCAVPDSVWKKIFGGRHVTKDAFYCALSISKVSVMAVTEKLDCFRVCAHLLP